MSSEMKEERREEDNGKACGDEYRGKSSTEVVRTVTEEEVDEFFKILRRLHVATRTVARVNGGDAERELPSKKRKRIQSLGLRSSLDTNEVQDGESDGINRVGLRNLGLDLNCQPETEAVKM
ncbi:protein NIM1-INTERACTING 2-like [Brassica napus]|uniref:protein NIM1-INTERACTING 2-like n=1 Tax=Brassica napus TaxID=3708 RepID=UPI0006AB6675|nr:protein NIM1-INTERACTING 2-like [Brassica napus]